MNDPTGSFDHLGLGAFPHAYEVTPLRNVSLARAEAEPKISHVRIIVISYPVHHARASVSTGVMPQHLDRSGQHPARRAHLRLDSLIGDPGNEPFPGYHFIAGASGEWHEANIYAGDGLVTKYIGGDQRSTRPSSMSSRKGDERAVCGILLPNGQGHGSMVGNELETSAHVHGLIRLTAGPGADYGRSAARFWVRRPAISRRCQRGGLGRACRQRGTAGGGSLECRVQGNRKTLVSNLATPGLRLGPRTPPSSLPLPRRRTFRPTRSSISFSRFCPACASRWTPRVASCE